MTLRLFKYLTLTNLLISFGITLYIFYLPFDLISEYSLSEVWSILEGILFYFFIPPIYLFIYIQLYRFNSLVRKLFLPLLIILELSTYAFEPVLTVQENLSDYYWDLILEQLGYVEYFINGMIFTLVYFTEVQKKFK